MKINVIRTGVFSVNTLVVEIGDKKCFVVDPAACRLSFDETKIVDYLHNKKLECVAVVLTHSHFDHIMGILPVLKAFPQAKIAIHKSEVSELQNPPGPMNDSVVSFFGATELLDVLMQQPASDVALNNGDTLSVIGNISGLEEWKVIHTPGHTPGSICLYNQKDNQLISGDTLFDYGGYGRTDMYGGDENKIIHSLALLREKIPEGTLVYPGHDSFGFSFSK